MNSVSTFSSARIEAFSDGVIAIILTIMVFDLNLEPIPKGGLIDKTLFQLLPKFISYLVSFLMVSVMWVNHHQLFQDVKQADRNVLWLNIHLLFCMSIVPFVTNLIGTNPLLWQASCSYGLIFMMVVIAFTFLRHYLFRKNLLKHAVHRKGYVRMRNKNILAMGLYLFSALLSVVSVFISITIFLWIPVLYLIPNRRIFNCQQSI